MIKNFVCLCLLLACINAQSQQLAKIKAVDRFIRQKMANSNLSGLSIAVVHYDTVFIAKGYGHDDNGRPITANSPFAWRF